MAIGCADWLREHASPDVLWWHTPNEAKRSKAGWAVQQAMGFLDGNADLTIIRGRVAPPTAYCFVLFIEFKARKSKQTTAQIEFASRARRLGIPYYVIRSLVGFEIICRAYRVAGLAQPGEQLPRKR